MPREIITLQIGQCGNQSNHPYHRQSAASFGNNFVKSTVSVHQASWRSMLSVTRSRTARMCSSTRLTMTTTCPGPSSSTWNPESSILYKMAHIRSCITLKIFTFPKKGVVRGIIGRVGIRRARVSRRKSSIWSIVRPTGLTVWRASWFCIPSQEEPEVVSVVSCWKS